MNRNQLVSITQTNWSPAMQAVAADTIQRNGGSAPKRLIVSEIERRLVDVPELADKFANNYSHNQYAELSATMGSNNTIGYGAIECSVIGWGIWSFAEHGYETADAQLSQSYNFGFDSIEEFIGLLDQYTPPFGVEVPEQPYAVLKEATLKQLVTNRAKVQAAKEEAKAKAQAKLPQPYLKGIVTKISNLIDRVSIALTGM